jgi:transcriptional regulator GlxA family with amidase domain
MWLRAIYLCLGNQKSVFTKDVSATGKCQDNVLAPDIKIDTILKAQQWMEAHLTENVSMENLAGHVGLSPRHFIR